MTKIKFRAWDKGSKEMYEVWNITGMNLPKSNEFHYVGVPSGVIDRKNIELLQYTGLKDKKGKEIYEGDIVRLHCGGFKVNIITATIKWLDEYARFCACIHNKMIKVKGGASAGKVISMAEVHSWAGMHTCLTENWNPIEVIGNIYQNPELLK